MENIVALVRPNIRRLQPYSSARHEFEGLAEVYLDANENPFNTGFNRYPDPLQQALKNEIAKLKSIPADHIFLGNGSDEAIDLLFRIFCEPGKDEVIVLPPTYGMYQVAADIHNVKVVSVPLNVDFQPNVSKIASVMNPNSKLLFLCSPNNPTGNSFEPELMRQLLKTFKGIVVIDEAYIDFAKQLSCLQWLSEYPNLVIMQTFSKAWGLAGLRLGMAFANPFLIALFNKVKAPYNINQLTQHAVLEALTGAEQTKEWIKLLLEERAKLEKALTEMPFVKQVYPSDANFLLVKVDDPMALYQYLVQEGIVVRNRNTVLLCEGCLRITVGTSTENQRLLEQLEKF